MCRPYKIGSCDGLADVAIDYRAIAAYTAGGDRGPGEAGLDANRAGRAIVLTL